MTDLSLAQWMIVKESNDDVAVLAKEQFKQIEKQLMLVKRS